MDIIHAEVYTDGGCNPNPGPGGWGAVIRLDGREWHISGNAPATTNNRMELQAAASALALLDGLLGRCRVDLYTDSRYLKDGITRWMSSWERNGWLTGEEQPVKNRDLWQLLRRLTEAHHITWHWLRGHAGHPFNELADHLATGARRLLTEQQKAASHHRPTVLVYVKAFCRGARGPGGWGAVLRSGERVETLGGGAPRTTINALLIRGATAALRSLTEPSNVVIHSDALYLIHGASLWIKGWQRRNWRTREGKPVANRELWEELLAEVQRHHVRWVKGAGEAATGPDDLSLAASLAKQEWSRDRSRSKK